MISQPLAEIQALEWHAVAAATACHPAARPEGGGKSRPYWRGRFRPLPDFLRMARRSSSSKSCSFSERSTALAVFWPVATNNSAHAGETAVDPLRYEFEAIVWPQPGQSNWNTSWSSTIFGSWPRDRLMA